MGALDNLDDFCHPVSQFWRRENYCRPPYFPGNFNCSGHDHVDISLCFEDTAILYAICALFWILAGFKFLCGNNIKPSIRFNLLHMAKLILIVVPVVTALCDLIYTIVKSDVADYQYVTPSVLIVTMLLVVLVLHYDRHTGVRSSGLMFVFWLSLVVYGSFKLRSLALLAQDRHSIRDKFRFTTFIFQYVAYIVELFLAIMPEPKPERMYQNQERKPCPEEDATFLSYITWWWLNGLIWLGWRKSLDYSDLTDLNYEDKSRQVAPRFQRNWDNQADKAGPPPPVVLGEYQPINVEIAVTEHHGARRQKEPSLTWTLVKTFGGPFMLAAVFKIGSDFLSFVSPQILKLLIQFTESRTGHNQEPEPVWKGYLYAVLMFLAAVLQSLLLHQYFHRGFRIGMRIRSAVIAAVYRKALRLSNKARQTSTVGEIVNLMSVDAQRFQDLVPYLHMLWSAPLQIVLALIFLYISMGPSIFAGFVVMVLLIPVNAVIATVSRKFQVKQMTRKDSRIKLMNEVLNGIKVIKLYAWEIPFQEQIMDIRKSELKVLKASAYLNGFASFTWSCAPFLVALSTFATYVLVSDEPLTAEKAFVALSLFNILRFPIIILPFVISMLVQASVSLSRLQKFLRNEELDPYLVQWRPEPAMDNEDSVSMIGGKFAWDITSPGRPTLSDLTLHVKRDQLVAVVGQVGAGKSSLIQALLGEMDKLSGSVSLRGTIAYVPQQAWIQNATLKDNILFGKPMNGIRYGKTLEACALGPDLEILPGGDMTEIGEKGINLSGGQKQRVSLARAVYQNADIYLLDDPLSAVDSHVGKHIFEKVIGPDGMLKGKVRILVTHGIGFLPQCDQVVVMDEGKIREMGSYTELIDNDGVFAEFLRTYANMDEDEEGDPVLSEYSEYEGEILEPLQDDAMATITPGLSDDADHIRKQARRRHYERQKSQDSHRPKTPELKRGTSRTDLKRQLSKQLSRQVSVTSNDEKAEPTEQTGLITEEKAETGTVRLSVLITYCRACTFILSFLVLLFYVLSQAAQVAANFWLAEWSNAADYDNTHNKSETNGPCNDANGTIVGCYLGIYAGVGSSQAIFILFGSLIAAVASILAAQTLHDNMLKTIVRAPMSFFDTTPLGRILNRFSKDIYTIDDIIPRSLRMFIFTFLSVVSTIIVIIIATPVFAVVILPLGLIYLLIQRFYVATSRQLKRLESISRSPIYSHFQETILGAASIRAYHQQDRFLLESEERVDYNQMAYYPSICSNRWLAIRLEFLGNLVIFFAALFAVLQTTYQDKFNLNINAGLVGLSISYALQVTSSLNWMVRQTSELETNIVAVERTKEYSEVATEAPPIIDNRRPPRDWPSEGNVKFDRYSTRYRPGLDLVLKDISVDVAGGTKVGIVGRTGAGKSSLTVALFRIIEACSGGILIDNINIAVFGLDDLRSRITIIPQDPVLFSGTLRVNLDPFNSYSDEEVWRALDSAHLSSFVSGLAEKLQYPVAEGGENLSVGQRQLVCLARALLRKTKILVLDEATAAVDLETDDLIQKTIRSEFAACTVLTIAHRLNTIMDYDYVMVLDTGRIVEYASPGELLSNKKTVFYSMAKDAGLVA